MERAEKLWLDVLATLERERRWMRFFYGLDVFLKNGINGGQNAV